MRNIFLIILCIPFVIMGQDKSKKKVDAKSGATGYYQKKEETFKGSVKGKIIDVNTNQPLSYANVSIVNFRTNKSVEGTITSENGKFTFEEIETGTYNLIISFVGYKTQEIKFELTKKYPDKRFKRIKLEPSSKEIQEIEIKEEKAVYENKIDKIVYNPQNDILQTSDDATDVLRKTPLLSVDLEGNVSLRGSKNIKFLINGKTSAFFSSDISTALQLIPADEIKSIEVITTPGAKYDGEGDAGIVNIITNKKVIDGYQATLSGSVGTKVNRNSLNLTLGKGRFGISAKGGAHYSWPRVGETNYTRTDWDPIGNTNTLLRDGNNWNQWIGYNAGINMFYDINAYQSITSNIYFGGRRTFSNDTTDIKYMHGIDSSRNYEYTSYSEQNKDSKWIEWNTDYTKKFAKNEGQELTLAIQISGEFQNDSMYIKGMESSDETWIHNYNNIDGIEQTFQADYTHPFGRKGSSTNSKMSNQRKDLKMPGSRKGRGKGGSSDISSNKIETGFKIINRNRDFQYRTESSDGLYFFPEENYNYNQLVAGSYLSTQFQLPAKLGLVLGVRYESTIIEADSIIVDKEKVPVNETYSNILPNFILSKKLDEKKSLKLSFNTRIRRPSSSYINPNESRTDNKNIIIGNPTLRPSITNQIELGYNSFGIIQSSIYLYAKRSEDMIEANVQIIGDTSFTNYINIGESSRYGLNYYGGIMLRKISLRGGFNISSYNARSTINNQDIEIKGVPRSSYNFGGTIDLGKGIKFETWAFFRSPTETLQGSSTSFSMMSFGIKKEFKNKRGSLGIRVIEPFLKDGYKSFITDIEGPSFTQYSESRVMFRSIGISFKYTFGKLNFKSRSTNSSIKNDDLQKIESQTE